jgi:hypothetical protein
MATVQYTPTTVKTPTETNVGKTASQETLNQIKADQVTFNNANKGIGPNDTASNGVPNTTASGASSTPSGGWKTTETSGTINTWNEKGELVSQQLPNGEVVKTVPEDTNTTIESIRQANQQKPLNDLPTTNISPTGAPGTSNTTVTEETFDTGTTNTVSTTTPGANAPASQRVSSISVDHVTTPQNVSLPSDWRVRLSLAPAATYLYKDPDILSSDILFPLKNTGGVIFPYLPQINVSYRANYNSVEITHTNYKNYFYTNSSVDDISITADFTAQDNEEAKYMLAVIHFFKSVTKMFYGQDIDPRGGTPPPLCYLSGLGLYQFNNHPLVLSNFTYTLPNDVDYIRTESTGVFNAGGMTPAAVKKQTKKGNIFTNFLQFFST